ncbi:MAG: ABC transporter ATP-binding protein [Parcubacteria group bacterium]|nr:ABC transporter ATP-binding protein [Parcubacteria group bacterium]
MKIFQGSKIIWQYLKEYKRKVYWIALVASAGSIISAVIPYIYGRLVDLAITEFSRLDLIGGILLIWLILSLFGDWLNRTSGFRGNYIGVDVANDLIVKISSHIVDLPISFHKDKKMGEINRRMSRGASYLENIIGDILFYLLPSFLTIVIALGIMFRVEWRLAGSLAIVLLIYSLATI